MEFGLQDRRVLVTGGSGRIGRAVAVAFGHEGARIALTYRRRVDEAQRTARAVVEAGGSAMVAELNLGEPDGIEESVSAIQHDLGGSIDVLVNNAVLWPTDSPELPFEGVPLKSIRTSIEANLVGHYATCQAVVGSMRQCGWGRIVHVSTGLVEDGFPRSAPYTTPKAGLQGLTRTMSRELAGAGIYTNVVMAGFVPSADVPPAILEQGRRSAATGRLTEPEDVASIVVFLCSEANRNITGETIRADGHFLAIDA
jgi:3-oxoacyl-[acyl-carrier protein] reductase